MPDKLYLVLGLGKTGHSVARYLRRRGIKFAVFDTRNVEKLGADFKKEFPEAEVFLEYLPENFYAKIAAIIASPGVDGNLAVIQKLKSHHIPFYGDIECFAQEVRAPVIAVTGTNGKSTVTSLVGEMAKSQNLTVGVAGNIGTPVLDLLDDGQKYALWVLELSSFQLELLHSLKPLSAAILNISPDHLDRHGTLDNYIAAKQRIYQQAKYCVYNRQDRLTNPLKKDKNFISYGLDAPQQENDWGLRKLNDEIYLAHGSQNIMPILSASLKGTHNWLNILAASALAHVAGISYTAISNTLANFQSLPHRCEFIRNLAGVDWIDDSKGTNIGATIAALQGLGKTIQGKIVLIAGGQGKGADFKELRSVVGEFVKAIVVIGVDALLLKQALEDICEVIDAQSLADAVQYAKNIAEPGDMVLLSPACASLDMFKDYNHRGEVFAEVVRRLPI